MKSLEFALKDFFSFKFLMFSLIPLAISMLIFIICVSFVINLITSIDISQEHFQFFLGMVIYYFLHVLLFITGGLAGIFSTLHGWQISVIFSMFITSFLTPYIVSCINKAHYNHVRSSEVGFFRVLLTQLGFCLKSICFFIPACLIYLIPGLGLLIAPLLLSAVVFYLYFNFMMVDVSSNILNAKDFRQFSPLKLPYLLSIFIYYVLCNIPYVGFFLQVFFIIHLSHMIFLNEIFKPKKIDEAQFLNNY